ncbi:MAG: family ATPase, partial [Bacilli bacterium]|nr:family ATPase [Bacilli bacterium]
MNNNSFDPFLRGIELERHIVPSFDYYPFNLGVIKSLSRLDFHPKVTYIVGENGMGKSTLMESIAVSWGFNPEGGTKNFSFSTQSTHSNLHEFIRLVRGVFKPRDGFFFR